MNRVILLLLFAPLSLWGQRIVSEIEIQSKAIKNVQLITVSDSIYLKYDQGTDEKRNGAVWISSKGKQTPVNYSYNFLDIVPFGDTLFYYFLEEDSKTLRACTSLGYGIVESVEKFKLDGEIVGTYRDKGLNLILINKELKKIIVLAISRLSEVSRKEFDLPEDLADKVKDVSKIEFINGYSPINSFQGISKLRIYRSDNIYLTFDNYTEGSKTNTVKLLKIDLADNKSEYLQIPITNRTKFRSFIYQEKLYVYFVSTKVAELKILDFSGNEIYSHRAATEVTKNLDAYVTSDFIIYYRHGSSNTTGKSEFFSRFLRASYVTTNNTISIFQGDLGTPVIICGTYYNDKGIGTPSSANPLVGIVHVVIGTALRQVLLDPPGIRKYYYYEKLDDGPGYKFGRTAKNLRQRLDDYEIDEITRSVKYDFKGYFDFNSKLMAVYQKKNDEKLTLVYFE